MSIPGLRSPQSDALVPYGPPQDDDQQLVIDPLSIHPYQMITLINCVGDDYVLNRYGACP